MAKEITVVVVSDLHCGSEVGICSAKPDREIGGSYNPNKRQEALLQAYESLTTEWASPDILIINGDAIEGRARRESGVPCWSVNLTDQLADAEKLIEMWNAGTIYVTDGTGYHVDAEGLGGLENKLAKNLGAVKVGHGKKISADELFLRIGGLTFHFAHHISVGSGWYRTTPLAKEMAMALLNASHKHKADVTVRSHCHFFCGVEFTSQKGFITPCWQLQTRYLFKKGAWVMPDIGAIRFRVKDGQVAIDKRFFRPDAIKPRLHIYDPEKRQDRIDERKDDKA